MRIKKIEIIGFKSFADREVVHVDDRITGVIGPNGCGKSNIVDAMRWGLGEQRAKHLRGSGMRDVIFAGTTKRGPGGLAEVTLTFENQGNVPAAYLNYAEIAVTRRLYRDGTSEYLINKVPCRLRDINELMTGTGAGARGYSIIEQGQVGRLVTSKPEEIRRVIDEAAGITRFKAQKQSAERKIAKTGQNLLRISDVIAELEGRLGTLRRQAQKAERYKRYRTEQRDLELWMASHRFLELDMTGRVLERREADLGEQVDVVRRTLETHETRLEAERIRFSECERSLNASQQRVYDHENRLQLIEAENQYRERERGGLSQAITQSEAEAKVVTENVQTLETELEEARAQLRTLADSDLEPGDAAERYQEEHDLLNDQLRTARADIDRARAEMTRLETRAATLQAKLESRVQGIEEITERLAGMADEEQETARQREELSGDLEFAREASVSAKEAARVLGERRVALDRERIELRERVKGSEAELDTVRGELQRARSRLQSLEEIQNRYRSCTSGVQVIMEHRARLGATMHADGSVSTDSAGGEEAVLGIMADHIAAPAHLEAAVSAVLGDRLQGVVVNAPNAGACGVELLKEVQEGRTWFLPRDCRAPQTAAKVEQVLERDPRELAGLAEGALVGWSSPSAEVEAEPKRSTSPFEFVDLTAAGPGDATTASPEIVGPGMLDAGLATQAASPEELALQKPGVLGRLADLIDVSDELRPLARVLLGDTIVVDRLGRALELWHQGGVKSTIVTTEGDRIEASGVVVGGSSNALDSALLQQKREIRELRELVDVLGGDFDTVRARHQGLVERLSEIEAEREASEQQVIEAERERAKREQEVVALERALAEQVRRGESFERDRERLQGDLERRQEERADMTEELGEVRGELPELEERALASEASIESLTERRDMAAERLTEAKIALARWQQQRDALASTKDRLERQAASERDRARRLAQKIEEAQTRGETLVKEIAEAEEERERRLDEHKLASEQVHDVREQHETARLAVEELELSIRNLRREYDQQREQLQDVELGLREIRLERGHLDQDVRERFDGDLVELLIDFHDRPMAGDKERDRLKDLKRILGRMGEVNLTAIDEYEEVSTRYEYLTSQKQDLEDAIAQLQEAIDRINKTTRERFTETFHKVNEMFQKVFPRLFSGGKAALKLTDPNDLLTTGVEIIAQPPGKQVRSLELLSGGEKALTATSLVFAIFLIKPSPFCLLDEVDAPLDEANVGRFCKMIQEMAETTQFIVITHNKRTMEIADRLYGVTMQERGVSKLVSVNMRKAVELTQS